VEESGALATGYFTAQTVLSFGSSTLVVFVVCNALQHAFSFNPRWLAFVLSQIIAMAATYASSGFGLTSTIVGFVNGCLVYCTSIGATQVAHTVAVAGAKSRGVGLLPRPKAANSAPSSPPTPAPGEEQRTFSTPWF
jgi:hypothetical protein